MTETLKILMLEDSPIDAEIIQRLLRKEQWNCEFSIVLTREDYLLHLDQFQPTLILADNSLPQFNAREALELVRLRSLYIPFIMVTGTVPDEFAIEMVKAGADDYILKDRLKRLPAVIETAIKQQKAKKEKQDAQEEIRQSNERFQTLSRATKDAVWDMDLVTHEIWWNESFFLLLGYDPNFPVPDLKEWTKRIHPDDRNKMTVRLQKIMQGSILSWEDELRLQLPNGSCSTVMDRAYVLKEDGGKPVRLIGVFVDITEQRKIEEDRLMSRIKQQKEFTRAILEARELERNTMARGAP